VGTVGKRSYSPNVSRNSLQARDSRTQNAVRIVEGHGSKEEVEEAIGSDSKSLVRSVAKRILYLLSHGVVTYIAGNASRHVKDTSRTWRAGETRPSPCDETKTRKI